MCNTFEYFAIVRLFLHFSFTLVSWVTSFLGNWLKSFCHLLEYYYPIARYTHTVFATSMPVFRNLHILSSRGKVLAVCSCEIGQLLRHFSFAEKICFWVWQNQWFVEIYAFHNKNPCFINSQSAFTCRNKHVLYKSHLTSPHGIHLVL